MEQLVDSSSSDEDIIILGAILAKQEEEKKRKRKGAIFEKQEEEKKRKKKRKSYWIHPLFQKRKTLGEFHYLFPKLLQDEKKFFKYFRMSRTKFHQLHNLICKEIEKKNTTFRRAISTEERLAVCLRFLATGDSIKTIAFDYHLGHTTVCHITHETCMAIWQVLEPLEMPAPSKEEWVKITKEFWNQWQFPNCVGALDGKHVIFDKAASSFNIVLLGLVDANDKFILVDVGSYDRDSDGAIFANSMLGKKMLSNQLDLPEAKAFPGTNIIAPHVIIGDGAFPLKENLMIPYPDSQTHNNEEKKIFNYRLSRARRVSKNCFEILTKKFRIFQQKLKFSAKHMETLVLATCVLHNFVRNDSLNDLAEESAVEDIKGLEDFQGIGCVPATSALQTRDKFTAYFVSEAGAIAWQKKIINQVKSENSL